MRIGHLERGYQKVGEHAADGAEQGGKQKAEEAKSKEAEEYFDPREMIS